MSAYAALTVCGYRGVSGFYDPAIRLLFFLHRPGSALRTPDFSPARLFFFRESPVPSQLFHCVLCALCANLVFQDIYKTVSRRRKKKNRLRRDDRVGLSRGKWFLRPRDTPLALSTRDEPVQMHIAPSQKEGALTPR